MSTTRAAGRGTLFVVSGPSGTGKSTLTKLLLERVDDLRFSVSYTTRPKRTGERDGREYHFVDEAAFDELVASDGVLEWAWVFGQRYGTARAATEEVLGAGLDLLLDIDIQGARQIRAAKIPCVMIFVMPPGFSILESRLRYRGSEAEGDIARRLAAARAEAEEVIHYDYVVINGDVERASRELQSIVIAERSRVSRRGPQIGSVLETFPSR